MSPSSPTPIKALKPLRGVRVLSLALNLPGPAAFMRLKAMGANCLKAEPPGPKGASGDPMGQYNPTAYATLHDGIKVVTIDLKTDKGQARLHKELARTDVLADSARKARAVLDAAVQAGLRAGARFRTDTLNAVQVLYTAERDWFTSRVDALLQGLQLKAAAGSLEERDIARLNGLLASQKLP